MTFDLLTWVHSQGMLLGLFPVLPTIQFLISCSMKKAKGEGLVHFITWITSVSTLGRQRYVWGGGVSDWRMNLMHACQEQYVFLFYESLKLQRMGLKQQGKASSSFFQSGTPAHLCLPKVDTDVIHLIKWTRPSIPLRICTLQLIKNWCFALLCTLHLHCVGTDQHFDIHYFILPWCRYRCLVLNQK